MKKNKESELRKKDIEKLIDFKNKVEALKIVEEYRTNNEAHIFYLKNRSLIQRIFNIDYYENDKRRGI